MSWVPPRPRRSSRKYSPLPGRSGPTSARVVQHRPVEDGDDFAESLYFHAIVAARYHYNELLAAGVRIFEKRGGTLHAKTMTCDGVFTIIGSVNLNGRSQGRGSEIAVAVTAGTTAAAMEDHLASVLAESDEVTLEDIEGDSILDDLWQWTANLLSSEI